jgi:hypothetical protein
LFVRVRAPRRPAVAGAMELALAGREGDRERDGARTPAEPRARDVGGGTVTRGDTGRDTGRGPQLRIKDKVSSNEQRRNFPILIIYILCGRCRASRLLARCGASLSAGGACRVAVGVAARTRLAGLLAATGQPALALTSQSRHPTQTHVSSLSRCPARLSWLVRWSHCDSTLPSTCGFPHHRSHQHHDCLPFDIHHHCHLCDATGHSAVFSSMFSNVVHALEVGARRRPRASRTSP